jgi:predicted esterase
LISEYTLLEFKKTHVFHLKFGLLGFVLLILYSQQTYAQKENVIKLENSYYDSFKEKTENDQKVSADSLIKILSAWNQYPSSYKSNQNYIFYYEDSFYGNVPMRLYVPRKYNPQKKSPLILLLHGAVGVSNFARANSTNKIPNESDDDDIFFNYLNNQDYLILRPFADPSKKFDWVVNDFNEFSYTQSSSNKVNLTFSCIIHAITKLKKTFNIDDNKIFAFGHSDGADGAFAMEIFQPTTFAGYVIYNSMLTNLKADNIYLGNITNSSSYIVHSDQDNLRPVEQAIAIIEILKKLNAQVEFKVYHGYKHFDNHLKIDLPLADKYIQKTIRNPFPSKIFWESNNKIDNQCSWLKVDSFKLDLPKKEWQTEINLKSYNQIRKNWDQYEYYQNAPGYVIKGDYNDNTFRIDCSRVINYEILISDKMVDKKKPIKIYSNGHLVFEKAVKANRRYIVSSFEKNFDRNCIWINSVKINANAD